MLLMNTDTQTTEADSEETGVDQNGSISTDMREGSPQVWGKSIMTVFYS